MDWSVVPWHICSKGLHCLASVAEDVPNPVETACPRKGDARGIDCKGRWVSRGGSFLSEAKEMRRELRSLGGGNW